MSEELFKQMAQSILDGEEEVAAELAQKALDQGIDPLQAITEGYMPGVNEVGDSFACGQAFLPELVMAGEAMKSAVAVLEPAMKAAGTQRQILGKVVLATVEGDIHEIGKSLVGTMLTSSGFEVYDLGVDVPTADLIAKAKEVDADIIGLSALLTTTMVKQKEVIDEVTKLRHESESHGWWRACDEGMGAQDRSGWLLRRCHRRGQCCQRVDGCKLKCWSSSLVCLWRGVSRPTCKRNP